MKKHRFLTVLIAVMLCLIVYGMAELGQMGNTLQYLFIAPEESALPSDPTEKVPKTQAKTYLESLDKIATEEWQNIISTNTLTGIAEKTAFSTSQGTSTEGRLWAVSRGEEDIKHKTMLFGRNFYPEELEKGRRICLIDEDTAIALFRVGDAVGQTLLINSNEYEVMGVIRQSKRVGDYEDRSVWVPLISAADDRIVLSYYMVSAVPIKGSGAGSAFKASMAAYFLGGTLWDLNRESVGAQLSVRVFVFILGLALVILIIKTINKGVLRFIDEYRQRLKRQYAIRLMPMLMLFILLFALAYSVTAGAFALLIWYIVQPVYVFPEWIPEVLVEWTDIRTAFWKVWQQNAQTMELRSPEVLRVRFFAMLLQWMTALCACLLPALMITRFKDKKLAKSVRKE